jgi:DNA (cytosine-5)-methyltransferase 1
MRLLDLFCCAGGAAMGYHRAGFEVIGVDTVFHPNYPFPVRQADALKVLREPDYIAQFDAIHASPPCQGYSHAVTADGSNRWARSKGKNEPRLIAEVRELLIATGKPWVIENVMGASDEMPGAVMLCGYMFDRIIPRHRLFESNVPLTVPEHVPCLGLAKAMAARLGWPEKELSACGHGVRAGTKERWQWLLGIDWKMTTQELAEAIPPVYTEHIGAQLAAVLTQNSATL